MEPTRKEGGGGGGKKTSRRKGGAAISTQTTSRSEPSRPLPRESEKIERTGREFFFIYRLRTTHMFTRSARLKEVYIYGKPQRYSTWLRRSLSTLSWEAWQKGLPSELPSTGRSHCHDTSVHPLCIRSELRTVLYFISCVSRSC